MREILYIGNHLSAGGGNPSVAEQLSGHLTPELEFKLVSRQRHKLVRLLDMLWAVLLLHRRQGPVVVDIYSTWNFYYALLAALICRVKRISCIGVLHGGQLPGRLAHSPIVSNWLFHSFVELISPSGYLKHAFEAHGYSVRVIPNPLSLRNYRFCQRRTLRPALLWVRAFNKTYNPILAVRVLEMVLASFPDAHLTMVGPDKDGSMEDCRQLVQRLGLEQKVLITGRLGKAEWAALSEDCDIFINTTSVDNTPVSVMEAMALGMPVVSTRVGGIPWLLENGVDALLVRPGDAEAMASAVIRLLKNDDLAESLSSRGRERANEWDMDRVVIQWQGLLKEYAFV